MKQKGFTLIELLVVIAIFTARAGAVIGTHGDTPKTPPPSFTGTMCFSPT